MEQGTQGVLQGLVGLFLICNAWQDWRKREILPASLWVFGGAGLALQRIWGGQGWQSLAGGVFVGVMLLFCALVTRGNIGMGDGLLLCITGLYLGFEKNLTLALGGLLLCGCCSAILLLTGRVNKKTGIPFAPFLLGAYLGGLFL